MHNRPRFHLLTLIAIAAIVEMFASTFHEGIHALVCKLYGGEVRLFTMMHVDCNCEMTVLQRKFLAGSA